MFITTFCYLLLGSRFVAGVVIATGAQRFATPYAPGSQLIQLVSPVPQFQPLAV
jgi:hypothetical protein